MEVRRLLRAGRGVVSETVMGAEVGVGVGLGKHETSRKVRAITRMIIRKRELLLRANMVILRSSGV
jgi:hypothetical protein